MKKMIIIFIGIGTLMILITGCPLKTAEELIEECISDFEYDLNNSDRSDLYTYFHPDTESYDQIKNPEFFEGTPLATDYIPITFSNLSFSDEKDGQIEVTADFENNSYEDTCTFIMEQDGEDWLIRHFTLDIFEIYKNSVIKRQLHLH